MSNNVFFHKIRNTKKGTASVIVSSAPLKTEEFTIAGIKTIKRSQQDVKFGVWSFIDPTTNTSPLAGSKVITDLAAKFKSGDEMPGLTMSDKPILKEDGSESGVYWVV